MHEGTSDNRSEEFSDDEREILDHYFTNVDGSVFCLRNLNETVKAALFSRYSRSKNSMRRVFLDEFYHQIDNFGDRSQLEVGGERANKLFRRVIADYGDDSVAQLAGVHIALEGVSNVLTKVIERPRLMSYLEQSTRYLSFGKRADGTYPFAIPPELSPEDSVTYSRAMNEVFSLYEITAAKVRGYLEANLSDKSDTDMVRAAQAASFDAARGVLPASVISNVGVFGSPQSLEGLIMHLRASELSEAKIFAEMAKAELEKVVPAFISRLDQPDRGLRWVDYLSLTKAATREFVHQLVGEEEEHGSTVDVSLYSFDPDGEARVARNIICSESRLSVEQAQEVVSKLNAAQLDELFSVYVGDRANRRHKPGRAFEATQYGFDVVSDYGSFRDMQRHRLLSIDWQTLETSLGYNVPSLVNEAGAGDDFCRAMNISHDANEDLSLRYPKAVASYSVCMAYRIRYQMLMSAREAMHVCELRSQPSGHPSYRRIAREMHRLIAEVAKHSRVAMSMAYVDNNDEKLGRLEDERRISEKKRLFLPE